MHVSVSVSRMTATGMRQFESSSRIGARNSTWPNSIFLPSLSGITQKASVLEVLINEDGRMSSKGREQPAAGADRKGVSKAKQMSLAGGYVSF